MITYDLKLGPGIFGGSKTKFNEELLDYSIKEGKHLPGGYFPAVIDKTYLENDFAKFRRSYLWNPDPVRWSWVQDAFSHIFHYALRSEVMTFDEVISEMELSASPGFPWNQVYSTKRACLQPQSEGGQLELIRTIVENVIETGEIDYIFNGRRYQDVFWLTSPKSEIRPIEKINHIDPTKRKTRTFMCGDLITHIIGYMLYKNQNNRVIEVKPTNSWVGVGLNPWYGGWDKFSRVLLRNRSKKFHSKDVSHMEASVNKAIQELIYNARNDSLKESSLDKHAKQWYLDQVTDSLIIDVNGYLCQKCGKNPSGQINTLTDNTFALIVLMLYAISEYCVDYFGIVQAYYEIAASCTGDDSIFEDDYRLSNLELAAKDLGFELTEEAVPGPLENQSYLSSNFFFHENRSMWIQKPNYEKILANVLYNFKKSSWRYTYVKLCAARKLVYAYPEWRENIDDYLEYIAKNKMTQMEGESFVDEEISIEACLSQFMPNSRNDYLVFGDECGQIDPKLKNEDNVESLFNYFEL